jgi:hypothetical protein
VQLGNQSSLLSAISKRYPIEWFLRSSKDVSEHPYANCCEASLEEQGCNFHSENMLLSKAIPIAKLVSGNYL